MIPRVLAVCPDVSVLVMLRDPVSRAYSQYQMSIDTSGTEEQKKVRGMASYFGVSFENAVEREIQTLADIGISVHFFTFWFRASNPYFKDGRVIPYVEFKEKYLSTLPMNHGGHSLIAR